MFSLIYVLINGWVNNREAGDFRRHRGHYDVIVMKLPAIGCVQGRAKWTLENGNEHEKHGNIAFQGF